MFKLLQTFYDIAKQYKFKLIPFASVHQLLFRQNSLYQTSHRISDFVEICIEIDKTPCTT